MKRYLGISLACFCSLLLVAGMAFAKPVDEVHTWAPLEVDVDVVGNVDGTPAVSKAAQDTVWIADWSFDPGCSNAFDDDSSAGEQVTGWYRDDFRILNDGSVFWQVNGNFAGTPVDTLGNQISGNAAVLTNHDLCWVISDGYGPDWYQAICIHYVGDSWLTFDVLVDSEAGFDFLFVETDSACASASRVNYPDDPSAGAAAFRDNVTSASGQTSAHYDSLALDGYGTNDTHCVYIAFFSDGGFDQADGFQPTANGAALVVDNVLIEGAFPSFENWDGGGSGGNAWFSFQNLQDNQAFGMWMRVFTNISDNDVCTSNNTCAWLDTDHTNPTVANTPGQSFGPNQYVMKSWKDTIVIGPWASLASTPTAVGTVLSFRRFPGNFFTTSRAVQNWSVRGKTRIANTDTPAPGDSLDCITPWGHVFQWNSLSLYTWITSIFDMSSNFPSASRDVQVRFRNSDWQWIASSGPPNPFQPGPGPYWDRVRIGRRVLTGPVINEGIDGRYQANDGAPTTAETGSHPAPNWNLDPAGDIYGTTAFSRGTDGGINGNTPNLIVGDSCTIIVQDVRNAGGIQSVNWYGCIVRGPHAGKAPPPYTVGANGFFCVPADTGYVGGQPSPGNWAIDMDDTYFRGGDEMRYFWLATDVLGGSTSNPVGLTGLPTDLADAEAQTGGLFEVSYLPAIDWDPAYLAAIAADANGDIAPSPGQIANSSQKNCILYYNHINSRRRSGDANRTSFMQTLDQLGYKGCYDVYDHMGLGNTNNALGSRMTVAQARGYSIIVMDAGNRGPGAPIIPDGLDSDAQKIDMDTWLTQWLQAVGQGVSIPNHTVWFMASNGLEEGQGVQFEAQAQVALAAPGAAVAVNPYVVGQLPATMAQGCVVNAPLVSYTLQGGCPVIRDYDAITPLGLAVETHTYDNDGLAPIAAPGTGKGAIVMHADLAFGSNTLVSSHPWFDIRDLPSGPSSPEPEEELLKQVLNCVLPLDCRKTPDDQVAVPGEEPELSQIPTKTALYQNHPNPFNPVTTIKFDLARDGHVSLNVYDVAGRLVRTLLSEKMTAGRGVEVKWNGLDNSGRRTSSGVYFYRLVSGDFSQTNKMVLMK